ncbi:PI-PLC X domain-containing protein 1-like [Hetaerina americana]|uniref:PI-PLC X domain-containing protein 1-like n=1 Tax=Hetaerina americana TaxID=62018 RepID=UPI003A7F42FA
METLTTSIMLVILLVPILTSQAPQQSSEMKRCSRAFLTISSLWRPHSYSSRTGTETELELNWETNCNPEYIDSVALFTEYPRNKGATPLLQVPTKQYPGYFRTNYTFGDTLLPGGWQLVDDEEDSGNADSEKKSSEEWESESGKSAESKNHNEGKIEVRRENYGEKASQEPINGDHCFPFWIAAYANKTIVYTDCLKIRPTWIWDHRSELGDMSLRSLLIPGTHNSGCYKRVTGLSNQNSRRNSFSSRFLLTQDLDIYTQLVYGIRYLDIRVGYYPSTPELFWVNHDVARLLPLQLVLEGVKQFLRRSPDPILLDLHRFPVGFSDRRRGRRKQHSRASPAHRLLVELLWNELGEFTPADASVPINTLWKSGRRLLISYADKASREEFPWLRGEMNLTNGKASGRLWNKSPSVTVTQEWGNVQNSSQLYDFLSKTIDKRKKLWGWSGNGELWSSMAELTPTPMDVVFSRPGTGLRQMAHDVNRNVTRWFRDLWWQDANIVATDFFRGANLIDVAVESNLRRSHV